MKTWLVTATLTLFLFITLPACAEVPTSAAQNALQQLLQRGKQTHSDAVLVLQDGRELGRSTFLAECHALALPC